MSYLQFVVRYYTPFFVNRLLGRDTIVRAEHMGISVRLKVGTGRELRRARKVAREALLVDQALGCLREGDVVYDIGANIGVISLMLAMSPAGRNVRIHGFEPEPRNAARFLRNSIINGVSERVSVHQMAVGDSVGEVALFVQGATGEGRHSVATDVGSTGSITVPMTTVAAFAAESDAVPDVLKIDIEGAEGRALAGMSDLLGSGKPREILMEIHRKGDGDRMPGGETIRNWLTTHGYSLVWESERLTEQQCHYHLG